MVDPNDPPDSEKRENPRTSWMDSDAQVTILSFNSASKASGWIQDISQGGFKLKTETPPTLSGCFQKWDKIHFETSEDFFQLKGQGRIVWTSPMEYGRRQVRFPRRGEQKISLRISWNIPCWLIRYALAATRSVEAISIEPHAVLRVRGQSPWIPLP